MTARTTPTDARLDRDARALFAVIRKLLQTYQFRDRQRICYHDITVTQCYALEALAREGAMGVNRIAKALRLEKSSASRMLDALEAKGYVRRTADPNDGRAKVIEITPRGRRLHDDIVEELVQEKRDLLSGISAAGRAEAIRIIGELSRLADTRFGDAIDPCASVTRRTS